MKVREVNWQYSSSDMSRHDLDVMYEVCNSILDWTNGGGVETSSAPASQKTEEI